MDPFTDLEYADMAFWGMHLKVFMSFLCSLLTNGFQIKKTFIRVHQYLRENGWSLPLAT